MERIAKEQQLPVLDGCGRGANDYKTLHQRYTKVAHGDSMTKTRSARKSSRANRRKA